MTSRLLICALAFLFPVTQLSSQESEDTLIEYPDSFEKAEEPDWIVAFEVDPHEKPDYSEDAGAVFFLLLENQYDIESATRYSRYIKTLRTESGVQDDSQISIDIDPSYQRLVFHRLRIHRDGETIDRLPDQEFRMLEREEDHDRQLYDSSITVMALMEDTRVGDTIEYAFSIIGKNPVFDDGVGWSISTSYSVPVGYIRIAYRKPKELRIFERQYLTDLDRHEEENEDTTLVYWEVDQPEPVLSEGELPWDYDVWGWVEISSYESWAEVADWAVSQYTLPSELPTSLEGRVEEISKLATDEEQILAALRFVQDEIRYLGIFEGVHSHRPHAAETILQRRFGDCKDKTVILVTMLRELGFEAHPALVETDYRNSIEDWLPRPAAFDHVVALLRLGEEEIWLDATRNYQRGRLRNLYFPDFGKALVIEEGAEDLTDVTPQGFEKSKMTVEERFTFDDYSGPATLEVETIYEGRRADSMRRYFADTSLAQISKDYLDYYDDSYPDVESTSKLRYEDDEAQNVFRIFETYKMTQIWEEAEDDPDQFEVLFRSDFADDELDSPSTKNRSMPFAIAHPRNVEHRIVLRFPTPMNEDGVEEPLIVEDPAFRYEFLETLEGRETELRYRYKSLNRRIEPERIPEYLENLDLASSKSNYWVWISRDLHEGNETSYEEAEEPFRLNWTVVVLVLFSLTVSSFLCRKFARSKLTPRNSTAYDPDLDGISGWLILPAIGAFISPVFFLIVIVAAIREYDDATWQQLTTPGEASYHALWEPTLIFEVVSDTAFFPLSILVLILFVKKHYLLPRLMVFTYAVGLLVSIIQYALIYACTENSEVRSEYLDVLNKSILPVVIWVPYFLVSVRVASTFRDGMPGEESEPPPLPVPSIGGH